MVVVLALIGFIGMAWFFSEYCFPKKIKKLTSIKVIKKDLVEKQVSLKSIMIISIIRFIIILISAVLFFLIPVNGYSIVFGVIVTLLLAISYGKFLYQFLNKERNQMTEYFIFIDYNGYRKIEVDSDVYSKLNEGDELNNVEVHYFNPKDIFLSFKLVDISPKIFESVLVTVPEE